MGVGRGLCEGLWCSGSSRWTSGGPWLGSGREVVVCTVL